MPKITQLAKMLYSHERNIYAKIYQHHIVYSIPTYHDQATTKVISLVEKYGSLELTVRRNDTASEPVKNFTPVIVERDENLPDANGCKRRGDYTWEWQLPL